MNVEVSVKGSLAKPPVELRPLLGNNCQRTQISRRLAEKLGLTVMRDVYVSSMFDAPGSRYKWRISMHPIVVTIMSGKATGKVKVIYPIINCDEDDSFWEMIMANNVCKDLWDFSGRTCHVEPTPGPNYNPNVEYLGHNVFIVNVKDISTPLDEFFEFFCFDSDAVDRLAVNKARSQMVVVYHDSSMVYRYDDVPRSLFQDLESGASKGETVAEVRRVCPFIVIANFPEATLTNIPE